jgi:hypothetical protein
VTRKLRSALATAALCVTTLAPTSVAAQLRGAPEATVGGRAYPVDPLSVPRPAVNATRTERTIAIDGLLDDAGWADATATTDVWVQTIPDPGMPASEPTTLRLLYDDTHLYIGAVLHDSDPHNLAVPGLEQDFDTPSSDMFGVALDTYHDRQNGFLFAVNPAGAVWDAQAFNDQRDLIPAWEGIVDVRTSVNDSSWIVEMAIPFATLRFTPGDGEQVWGVNFSRRIRRRNEDAIWAPIPLQYRVYKFSMAGTLEGLSQLPRGRNLWFKPYAAGSRLDGAGFESARNDGDVGLDVKWGLTPRMTLDLTVNTDFSQVEVDQEQVNLTRFSLFFPERRDFFLENEGTFAFTDVAIRNYRTGSSPRSFRLFNSRRIGLSDGREVLPIGGGARLTGRIGERLEVGFLDMQTRSVGALGDGSGYTAENFAVARVKGHLGGGTTIGGMVVNRQETGETPSAAYNRSYGVDANVQVGQNALVSAYWARTDDSAPVGDDANIGMLQAAWRTVFWDASALFKQVGDGFDPRTGFIDRRAVRRYYATVGAHPQIGQMGILDVNPYVDADVYTNLSGDLETRTVEAGAVLSFLGGGTVTATVADRYERLFDATSIAGASVAAGEYDWWEPSVRVSTAGNKALSGGGGVQWGDFYDGTRFSVSANMRYRPNEHLSFDVGAQHNDLTLGGTSFTADLFNGRVRYAHDTRTFFMAFLQYNESTEELIANVRFNLIHAPLSDVFIVYTERRSLATGVTDSVLERGITLKVTKLLAF